SEAGRGLRGLRAGGWGRRRGGALPLAPGGGQKATHPAVTAALPRAFPASAAGGLRALPGQPVFYLSSEGHHSFDKVAHATGLGRAAVQRVAVDADLRMSVADLERRIAADRRAGRLPFLVTRTPLTPP